VGGAARLEVAEERVEGGVEAREEAGVTMPLVGVGVEAREAHAVDARAVRPRDALRDDAERRDEVLSADRWSDPSRQGRCARRLVGAPRVLAAGTAHDRDLAALEAVAQAAERGMEADSRRERDRVGGGDGEAPPDTVVDVVVDR